MRKRIDALLLGKLKHATPGLPCGGGISTASPAYPPASSDERRSHAAMNCNGNYSDGRYGKLRNGCPHSEIRSFRQPSALRKRRHPANRKSLRNIRSKAFYGMDIQERSPLPLAAEPSSARDRYGICVRCLPFISVFGNYIPPYTAVPPKPDCRSGSCPKPPSRRFFFGGGLRSVNAALPRTLRQPVVCSDSENRRSVKQGMAALFFSGPKAGFRFVPACAASVLPRAVQPEAAGDLRDVVFDVIHAAARLDRLLVFGTGGRLLPSKLAEPDSSGLLLVA